MTKPKIKFGISIDEDLMILVDATVLDLRSLDVSRSELIEVILTEYFSSNLNPTDSLKEIILRKRDGTL